MTTYRRYEAHLEREHPQRGPEAHVVWTETEGELHTEIGLLGQQGFRLTGSWIVTLWEAGNGVLREIRRDPLHPEESAPCSAEQGFSIAYAACLSSYEGEGLPPADARRRASRSFRMFFPDAPVATGDA